MATLGVVVGQAGCGKTQFIQGCTMNTLVIHTDKKQYVGKHLAKIITGTRKDLYTNKEFLALSPKARDIESATFLKPEEVLSVIKKAVVNAYKYFASKGQKLELLVIDTITSLEMLQNTIAVKHYIDTKKETSFAISMRKSGETDDLFTYLNSRLQKNINVILVSHSILNDKTGQWELPSNGSDDRKAGGLLAKTNEAIHLTKNMDTITIMTRGTLLCRTLTPELEQYYTTDINFKEFSCDTWLSMIQPQTNLEEIEI